MEIRSEKVENLFWIDMEMTGLEPDRERILETIDNALAGEVQLRPEWARGL